MTPAERILDSRGWLRDAETPSYVFLPHGVDGSKTPTYLACSQVDAVAIDELDAFLQDVEDAALATMKTPVAIHPRDMRAFLQANLEEST